MTISPILAEQVQLIFPPDILHFLPHWLGTQQLTPEQNRRRNPKIRVIVAALLMLQLLHIRTCLPCFTVRPRCLIVMLTLPTRNGLRRLPSRGWKNCPVLVVERTFSLRSSPYKTGSTLTLSERVSVVLSLRSAGGRQPYPQPTHTRPPPPPPLGGGLLTRWPQVRMIPP